MCYYYVSYARLVVSYARGVRTSVPDDTSKYGLSSHISDVYRMNESIDKMNEFIDGMNESIDKMNECIVTIYIVMV